MTGQQRRPVVLANSIRQKRQVNATRTFLIVEGDDDKLFFGRYANSFHGSILVAHGRPKVLEVMAELERTGHGGVLAIVDTDFTALDGEPSPGPNVLQTDHHDVECMLLDSSALQHVLRELGDPEALDRFEAERQVTITEYLLSLGVWIGYLRWASARNGWKLKFEELDYARFIREKDFADDRRLLIMVVRGHQGGSVAPPSPEEMHAAIDGLVSDAHDRWHVCCGHDLVEILAIGLRRVLGNNNPGDLRRDKLERELRLAYEEGYFRKTGLHAAIGAWEAQNPPYKVL